MALSFLVEAILAAPPSKECYDAIIELQIAGQPQELLICRTDQLHLLASYPGHVGGGKSGLVSTVCACANDSGNFSRTSPIMDKLHVIVMRRNNQTRFTACSVAVVFMVYSAMASIIRDTSGYTTRTTLQPPPVLVSQARPTSAREGRVW